MPRQVDDDIFLPPFSLLSLLRMGPLGDEQGCGVVLPLTQNGIPSTEIFARHWLSAAVAHISWCRYSMRLRCPYISHCKHGMYYDINYIIHIKNRFKTRKQVYNSHLEEDLLAMNVTFLALNGVMGNMSSNHTTNSSSHKLLTAL